MPSTSRRHGSIHGDRSGVPDRTRVRSYERVEPARCDRPGHSLGARPACLRLRRLTQRPEGEQRRRAPTTIGTTRLPTEPPAASSRSMGSASGESILRGPVGRRGAAAVAAGDAAARRCRRSSAGRGASASATAVVERRRLAREHVASRGCRRTGRAACSTRRPSRPRPNCATLPVMLRSVSMFTVVPSPSADERGGDGGRRVALAAGVAALGLR